MAWSGPQPQEQSAEPAAYLTSQFGRRPAPAKARHGKATEHTVAMGQSAVNSP